MCEHKAQQVRKFWDTADRNGAPAAALKTKETPRLKTLGDK
jgi:hypothetical protein